MARMKSSTARSPSADEVVGNVKLLAPSEAAIQLGIRTTTLYGWLGLARIGALILRGRPFELEFSQTGARGQGRIRIAQSEVERLRRHLIVQPQSVALRKPPARQVSFPGIHVTLGRPPGSR